MNLAKKILRDLALTLYDHPTEFQQMSLPRVWFTALGIMFAITWIREEFFGIKFSSWTALTSALGVCAGAYAFKKVSERGNINAPSNPVGTGGIGNRESN
jgi:hypothetical protein